jgi:DNA invertase Pin-like site-specific DNA recombinase
MMVDEQEHTDNNMRYVAYYRVSTVRQGRSGLGLDAQRAAVAAFLGVQIATGAPSEATFGRVPYSGPPSSRLIQKNSENSQGGPTPPGTLIAEFVEVESGKNNERPKLREALSAARAHKATLIIAKLDRLARNVAFIANLMESNVEFVACDMPMANRPMLHIMAAMAEHEAHMISARTKAALAQAKRNGVKLGGDRGHLTTKIRRKGARLSAKARAERADAFAADLAPTIRRLRRDGHTTLQQLAGALNDLGLHAPRGGSWSNGQVHALLRRL